jgi:hypothetical protein
MVLPEFSDDERTPPPMPRKASATKPSSARKTSTKPTRIWTFGAKIVSARTTTDEILWRSHRYYNALCEIERDRSARFGAIRREYAPELAVLEDRWTELDDQVLALYREAKTERQAHWRTSGGDKARLLPEKYELRKAELEAQKRAVSEAAKEHRRAFAALLAPGRSEFRRRVTERATAAGKDGKQAGPRTVSILNTTVREEMLAEPAWHPVWKAIAASDEVAHQAAIAARDRSGLYGGTYLAVEMAFARAKKDSSPRPPRFRRFDGDGKIQVQPRKGTTWATLGSDRIRIEPLTSWGTSKRSTMIRVTLDQSPTDSPEPIVVEAICRLHRVPPADAEVKWAALLVRRVGRRTAVTLQLTLEHPSFAEPKRPAGIEPTTHIRLGWARMADGSIRVAQWAGDESVVCPYPEAPWTAPNPPRKRRFGILEQDEHADAVQSARDRLDNESLRRLRLILYLAGNAMSPAGRQRFEGRRSRVRIIAACEAYAAHVFPDLFTRWRGWVVDRKSRNLNLYAPLCIVRATMPDREAVAWWAYLWARKTKHLEQLIADERRRFVHRRDAHYRAEAIRLATRYARLTIDDFSIAELKELPPLTMPGEGVRTLSQSQLQAAAPGRFRELLLEVMGPRCTPAKREKPAAAKKRAKRADGERVGAALDQGALPTYG